ncbi:hypothetical protein ACFXD5_02145 [Streptomyces sp. NPDC059385]|uniref:hypothetical protein n=1 Tax=Streptomyces sp. NPDC059385 TaxID=3346817 RepID=UPI0036B48AD9
MEVGGRVVWCTAAAPLAAYLGTAPDPTVLLAGFVVRGVDRYAEGSQFAGVRRVPPGRALVMEPVQTPRTEPVPTPAAGPSFEDGAHALREALTGDGGPEGDGGKRRRARRRS